MEIERIAEEAFKKEQGSIIVLTGEAPEQYNPEPVTINGNIDAAEMIETLFEQRVDQEVEKLKDFVTIIER
jgi:hypothetical protein